MKTLAVVAGIAVASLAPAWAASPLHIVAAENFYGDVAEQIGGANVQVSSVLSNPDQDPHLFEASPSVARNLSAARIVVYSGLDYDPWMQKLLGASRCARAQGNRRRRPDRREGRRQPAHLVRSGDHARRSRRP